MYSPAANRQSSAAAKTHHPRSDTQNPTTSLFINPPTDSTSYVWLYMLKSCYNWEREQGGGGGGGGG